MGKKQFDLLRIEKGDIEEVREDARNGGVLKLCDYSANEYDDRVVLNGKLFKSLFDTSRHNASSRLKLLAVVKVTNPKNGKSVHRAFFGRNNIKGLDTEKVALTRNTIRLLCDEENKQDHIDSVIISKGSAFIYFWKHPFHATRISMIGVVLSMASIILSVISLFLCCCCCC